MLRLLNSPDLILAETVKLLNSDDSCFKRLNEMITESSPSQLVPTFSFLSFWISSSISRHKNKFDNPKVQQSLRLLGLISSKVPPVILINGSFDLNWGISQPHWAMHDFYESINKRIAIIRSYFKPQSAFGEIFPFPFNNDFKDDYWYSYATDLSIDLGVESDYDFALKEHFKKLILNRASMSMFKPLLQSKNSKNELTQAIIELIDLFNSNKTARHIDLIASFSSLFLYINAFNNEIDGQKISEFLQMRSYISPSCALGITNHILPQTYIFNLLMPKEYLTTKDPQNQKLEQYIIYDPSRKRQEFSSFFKQVPKILSQYLLNQQQAQQQLQQQQAQAEQDNFISFSDLENFLEFINIAPTPLFNKIKKLLSIAKKDVFTPEHAFCLSSLFLNYIYTIIYQSLKNCFDMQTMTETFVLFTTLTFGVATPILECFRNLQRFVIYTPSKTNDDNAPLVIKGVAKHMMNSVLNGTTEFIVPFCIEFSMKSPPIDAQHLIRKLLNSDKPKLGPTVVESLLSSNDFVIVSSYIDALSNPVYVHTFQAKDEKIEIRDKLIKKLQIDVDGNAPFLVINEFRSADSEKFNSFSCEIIRRIKSNDTDISKETIPLIIFSAKMKNSRFANRVLDFIISNLRITSSNGLTDNLEATDEFFMLPIAEQCLERLLIYNNIHAAEVLINSISLVLAVDKTPLHWISKFSVQYRHLLTPTIKRVLRQCVIKLKGNVLPSDGVLTKETIYEFAQTLTNDEEETILQPSSLFNEYQSRYLSSLAFIQSFLALSDLQDRQIAEYLIDPLYEVGRYWPGRNKGCIALAKLASTLSPGIIDQYFRELMMRAPCETSMIAGRVFLAMIRIDSFEKIVTSCKQLIDFNDSKLDFFMRMILPSFHRLYGNNKAAVDMLRGMMENVSSKTPRTLQEVVVDAVSLIYLKLRLFDYRKEIINAASSFSVDLRAIIAGSLDTDFSNPKMKDLFKKQEPPKPIKRKQQNQ